MLVEQEVPVAVVLDIIIIQQEHLVVQMVVMVLEVTVLVEKVKEEQHENLENLQVQFMPAAAAAPVVIIKKTVEQQVEPEVQAAAELVLD